MPISEFPAVVTTGDVQREVGVAGIGPSDFQDTGSLIFVAGDRAMPSTRCAPAAPCCFPSRSPAATAWPSATPSAWAARRRGVPFTVAGIVAYSPPT